MRWLSLSLSSLTLRLALIGVLVIAACAAAITHVVLNRVEVRSERAVLDLEAGNAERLASLLANRIVGLQTALRVTADSLPRAMLTDDVALRTFLTDRRVLGTMFHTLFISQPDGRVSALRDAQGTRDPQLSIADRSYFKLTLTQRLPVVSEPIFSRVTNDPIVLLTMPIQSADGSVLAVIGGTLLLSARHLVDDLTQSSRTLDDPVRTIVIDAKGRILAHPDSTRVLKAIETEPGLQAALQRWTQQGRPIEPSADTSHKDGHFVAYAGVPGPDWVVFRVADDDTLMGGVMAARRESLLLAGAVALAGGLLLAAVLWWLLRPLRQLQRRAQALGDEARRIDEGWPTGNDEIGQLSKLLHRAMKERLQVETANAGLMRKMSSVMVAAPIGIAFTATQRLELVSHEFAALLGHEVVTLSGRPARDIFASDDDYDGLGPKVADAFSAGQPFFDEMQFRRRDGSLFWGRLQGRPVDSDDAAAGTIWLLEDVTAHRLERERLSWSASHDALTRLLNRAAFDAELEGLITRHGAALPAALLFIDLDHFKAINDSAGHAAGDQVLKAVAALLESKVRGADCVARIGGDEFAILLRQCDRSVALRIAEQVRSGAARIGIDHQGQRLQIGASIGVVAVVTPPLSVAELLARADAACYEAKRGGRDAVRLAEEPDAGVLRTDECAPG